MTPADSKQEAETERQWEADCFAREASEARMITLLAPPMFTSWALFDWLLDRPDFFRFLSIRLAGSLFVLAIGRLLPGTKDLGRLRRFSTATMLAVQGGISLMLPTVVGDAFFFYVLGFSLGGWAGGGAFTFPVRYYLTYSLGSTALWAVAELVVGRHSAMQLLGTGFYLVSVAIISAAMIHTRRLMARRLFEARHEANLRNIELSRAMQHLKDAEARLVESEKLSALGRLLAGLSHEINNPTNVIRNNLGPVRKYWQGARAVLLRARTGPLPSEELDRLWEEHDLEFALGDHDDALNAMMSATDRVGAVHASLRAFVRGDVAERVACDLNEGLRATVHLLRRNLPPGIELKDSYAEVAKVSCNPGEVNQVFFNLIQNAVDAMDGKGTVEVTSRVDDGGVEVSVSDDGPGISEAAMPRLFEPFFTTKGVGKGTGLGLATSLQIIERHKGTLRHDPEHNPGARFVVRLPVSPGEPSPPAPLPRRAGSVGEV